MLFSEVFSIDYDGTQNWLNPSLTNDVKLFVDPFLITRSNTKFFENSHKNIIDFFQHNFALVTKFNGDYKSKLYSVVLNSLIFPEVPEVCLGYSIHGTKGSGTSKTYAKDLFEAIRDYIGLGISDLSIVEQFDYVDVLNIFVPGISYDRISDIVCNLIKEDLINYTKNICEEFNIPCTTVNIGHLKYNYGKSWWEDAYCDLPINPYSHNAVLLVPKKFLRLLPTVSQRSFLFYLKAEESELFKQKFSSDIASNLNKGAIRKLLAENPKYLLNFLEKINKKPEAVPYDLSVDPRFRYKKFELASKLASYIEIRDVEGEKEIIKLANDICLNFKHWVEERGGYKTFWNYEKSMKETNVQAIFGLSIHEACIRQNIDVSKEPNMGRGPVDFKLSNGWSKRIHLELKLARNQKLLEGVTRQLPTYMNSEFVKIGFYLIVIYEDEDLEKIKQVENAVSEFLKDKNDIKIIVHAIDARGKPSASKL